MTEWSQQRPIDKLRATPANGCAFLRQHVIKRTAIVEALKHHEQGHIV
jgi:hypothetical protein